MNTEAYPGIYPAVVKSYDAATRLCRVEIPGITDGADLSPVAEIEYPIGDKSAASKGTEIEILAGDSVWVYFVGGNPEYPVISGFRNPQIGNTTGWRKWYHQNIALVADTAITFTAPAITLNSANVSINGESLKHNGVNVGDSHAHQYVQIGSSNSGPPVGGGGVSGGVSTGDGAAAGSYFSGEMA